MISTARYEKKPRVSEHFLLEGPYRARTRKIRGLFGSYNKSTRRHVLRTIIPTLRLAWAMGVSKSISIALCEAAWLHDIGKIKIDQNILEKPSELTDWEHRQINRHPEIGYEILKGLGYSTVVMDVALFHHERWDGCGYPHRLQGEQIPLIARVFSVVDVWEALSSNRPYRKAWPRKMVLEYIRSQQGKQFDPKVVESFLGLRGFYYQNSQVDIPGWVDFSPVSIGQS